MSFRDVNSTFGNNDRGVQIAQNSGTIHFALARSEIAPSPLFTVPFPPDPDYVDRGPLIDKIHEKLSTPDARVALVGLGGVGKSQIAIQYAHQVREASPLTWVLWIHASSAARFELSVRDILEQLKVPGLAEPGANVFQLLRSWLRDGKKGNWLIILDNADDARFLLEPPAIPGLIDSASQVGQHRERHIDYLPVSSHGSILVTSRTENVAMKIVNKRHIIAVEPMSEGLAVKLVRKKLEGEWIEEDVVQLVNALDRMPLAISQAAAYISQRKPRCSVQQYIKKLDKRNRSKNSLLDRDNGDLRRDREASNSIMLTWQISFEHISEIRRPAADLLSLMSFFDRQAIPAVLLQERGANENKIGIGKSDGEDRDSRDVSGLEGSEDAHVRVSSNNSDDSSDDKVEDFEEDLAVLRSYSFVSVTADPDTFEMHRLVQLATQKWLKSHGRLERWGSQFISNLDDAFPSGTYENWTVCRPLFPHAMAALEMELRSTEIMLRQASLFLHSGRYALEQGAFANAEKMEKRSVEIREKMLGEGHPDTLTSMANLARTYADQGRREEAEKLEVEVVETSKKVLGEGHPSTLTSMSNLASTYADQGRWEEAEKLQVEVLETSKKVLGEGHPSTLTSMSNLASTYWNQGRWEEAEKLQVEVLETSNKVLGEGHPSTLTSVANLASTYWNQGRWAEAEKLQVEVLETRKKVLGEGHPDTLTSMANLAGTYADQGRWEEAEKLKVKVLEKRMKVLGEGHPSTLRSMANLASTYWNQGRWEEAEKLQVKVLETSKKVLGEGHPSTLTSMANLARTYADQGRWEEAEKLEVEVLETRKNVLGEGHPDTLTSMANLAFTLRDLGRRYSAMNLMSTCAAISFNSLGADQPDTLERYRWKEDWERDGLGRSEDVDARATRE